MMSSRPGGSGVAASTWKLDPVTVVDGPHRCAICGDPLEIGGVAIQGLSIGLVHESCAEENLPDLTPSVG